MKKIKKSIAFFICIIAFIGVAFSGEPGVTCTRIVSITPQGVDGIHIEYWCCTGPQGCFWDVY